MSEHRGTRKHYFIVMNNTERSMCENAIVAIENGLHPLIRDTDKLFKSKRLIDTIKSEKRGFRIVIPQVDLWQIGDILRWYGDFSSRYKDNHLESESSNRTYAILGIGFDLRSQHMSLFNFDPKCLIDGNHADAVPLKISTTRLLLVRHNNKLVDFLQEMPQFADELDAEYQLRLNDETKVVCCKDNYVAEIVDFTSLLNNFKFNNDTTYFS